jgi:hypothetical protein
VTFNSVKIFRIPTCRFEREVGFVSSGMVDNLHCPTLFHPKLSDNDVVNTALDVAPSVGLIELGKFNRDSSFGLNLDAFPPKFQFRVNGTVKDPVFAFGVESRHRWVMADLFADDFEFFTFQFVSLSQEWIKGFAQAFPVRC